MNKLDKAALKDNMLKAVMGYSDKSTVPSELNISSQIKTTPEVVRHLMQEIEYDGLIRIDNGASRYQHIYFSTSSTTFAATNDYYYSKAQKENGSAKKVEPVVQKVNSLKVPSHKAKAWGGNTLWVIIAIASLVGNFIQYLR